MYPYACAMLKHAPQSDPPVTFTLNIIVNVSQSVTFLDIFHHMVFLSAETSIFVPAGDSIVLSYSRRQHSSSKNDTLVRFSFP